MTAIKQRSVIQENKSSALIECPVTYLMDKIGGYWKPIILFHLIAGEKRYGELKRCIPPITEKMLIQSLKQLEAENLIVRTAEAVVPPVVRYRLSDSGRRLQKVMDAMAEWVIEESKLNGIPISQAFSEFPVVIETWEARRESGAQFGKG
ncbi:winged helix-turn-helix transcriptional regulator [Flavobacterium selenitireducens]|uniref:winged helix-turn-helix transcriptional regulator n=1 Tax=Flavobacterium selenitireducens TaxID=2722704 RepID=UPI00168B2A30|nr:helix-turn-helix domain-containing protein [Flavobacterium selenitireducens]MBD3581640.1 helix-turn-helix transcriptional regulator [Flavobacterium selenitireducens]